MFCWLWWPGVGLNQARGGEGRGVHGGEGGSTTRPFQSHCAEFSITHPQGEGGRARGKGKREQARGRERERERERGGG